MPGSTTLLMLVLLSVIAMPAHAADVARGKALLADRQRSLCLLCHAGPDGEPALQGTLAPGLRGVGSRHAPAELRHHLSAPQDFNSETIMPSYTRSSGLVNVGRIWQNRPIIAPAELEDLIAYLATLKDAS